MAPPWAERFKFRGVVRNAMAMQPLARGNIVSIRATGTVAFSMELPRDVCTLRFNICGRYSYASGRETVCGAPAMLLPPGVHVEGGATDACILFVDIGCHAVANALGAEKLPAIGMRALGGHRGQNLSATAFAACRGLEDLCPQLRPAFLRNLQNIMACSLASLFRDFLPDLRRPDPMIGRRKVDELRSWAELDRDDPLTIGDLATHCGLGLRALQKNFLRHFDTTPGEFLRGLRLRKARALICSGAFTVTQAALDAGFVHLGHFSESYQRAFGELPSVTAAHALREHA